MGIESIVALAGIFGPSVMDFIKKKFLKQDKSDPEAVLGNLSLQSPDTMPPYVTALSTYLDAQTRFFNRDISGQPSTWIVDLRASIRPLSIMAGFVILFLEAIGVATLDVGTRSAIIANNSSWFGQKLI